MPEEKYGKAKVSKMRHFANSVTSIMQLAKSPPASKDQAAVFGPAHAQTESPSGGGDGR